MTTKTKNTKRKVGRPTLASLGMPPRIRRNLNIQRTELFDGNLAHVQKIIADMRKMPVENVTQTEAVQIAIFFYALQAKLAKDRGQKMCPHCNGIGYTSIVNGDDDVLCPDCATQLDTDVSF